MANEAYVSVLVRLTNYYLASLSVLKINYIFLINASWEARLKESPLRSPRKVLSQ